MFNQIFVPFLVEENLLTADQAKEVLEQQKHARIRMGVLAVEEKMMKQDDVDYVNRLQASQNARFGDIAIDRGFLTKEQVEELLNKQPREHLVLKQIITDKGYLAGDKYDLALGTFKTSLAISYDDFELLQDKDIEAFMHIIGNIDNNDTILWEYVKMFINTTIRFIDREVRLGKAYSTKNAGFKHVVWQKSAGGGEEYTYVLATDDTRAACAFSAAYAKFPIDDMNEDGQDSFKEFLNCVGGLLTSDLENRGVKALTIDVPDYAGDHALAQPVTVVPITLPMGEFYITVLNPTTKPANKKRFLLVDDSKVARHLLRTTLEAAGHEILDEATNGLDGFDKYRALKPDIITLDVTMPILNGIECLKLILAADPNAVVIMVTSVGKESLVEEALEIGAKAVIAKPIDQNVVLERLGKLL
ncbi:MAG: response regulator [Defluviitaleaceae bacterium]|nr:response regulator [Defluviitaleaceae bacterium]MCL2273471.1 response regulator [Defluviitaleaceae bacterium]